RLRQVRLEPERQVSGSRQAGSCLSRADFLRDLRRLRLHHEDACRGAAGSWPRALAAERLHDSDRRRDAALADGASCGQCAKGRRVSRRPSRGVLGRVCRAQIEPLSCAGAEISPPRGRLGLRLRRQRRLRGRRQSRRELRALVASRQCRRHAIAHPASGVDDASPAHPRAVRGGGRGTRRDPRIGRPRSRGRHHSRPRSRPVERRARASRHNGGAQPRCTRPRRRCPCLVTSARHSLPTRKHEMDQAVSAPSLCVLKFGSSVLRTSADFPDAVHEIYRYYRRGERIVAVVSAIGGATDALLAAGHELSIRAEPYATAELLATGERTSAALLGVALDRAGIPSRIVDPREVELTAEGGVLDAEPLGVNVERLHSLLREFPVLIIPGFFAVSGSGRTLLLGRGGSDLTAVFLAVALKASRCRLVKDVDGVYDTDPAIETAEPPQRFSSLSYADALCVAGPLIQSKTLLFLEQHRWQAEVAALGQGNHTLVHHGGTCRTSARLADQRS